MKKHAGLWIDHRRAIVVTVMDGVEATSIVQSSADRQPGRVGGVRSNVKPKALNVPADDSNDRRFHGQLDVYYDHVIAALHDAESILILGPGEAKGELRKRIERSARPGRTVTVETADKMTTPEIEARVRKSVQD